MNSNANMSKRNEIRLQTKPNRWSCVAVSFAMAINRSFDEFVEEVGHDGSEVIFPWLPEPMCRRGFHIQECIRVAVKHDFSVTPIELIPAIAPAPSPECPIPSPDVRQIPVLYGPTLNTNFTYFEQHIRYERGVITGVGRQCLHAVAFDAGTIFDPEGITYPYSQEHCLEHGFITQCLWLVNDNNP